MKSDRLGKGENRTTRILVLLGYKSKSRYWLSDFFDYSDVLDFKQPRTPAPLALEIMKQTLRALAIYRRYDMVFSWGMANILPLALVQTVVHRRRPKIIAVDISTSRLGRISSKIVAVGAKSLGAIICFTTAQKEWWTKEMNFDNAHFVRLAIETDRLQMIDAERKKSNEIENYIFAGGRSARDYSTLLKAVNDLNENLVIVSGKDTVTGRSGMERIASAPNLKTYWELPYGRYLELMERAKFVVLPLNYATYAAGQMGLLDAMAMGKPIIVTRTVATIDYVANGETALFVDPGNVEHLKQKIRLLSRDLSLRKKLGRNARARVEEEFNAHKMHRQFYTILNNCLSDSFLHSRKT